jgi:hypothetical protein
MSFLSIRAIKTRRRDLLTRREPIGDDPRSRPFTPSRLCLLDQLLPPIPNHLPDPLDNLRPFLPAQRTSVPKLPPSSGSTTGILSSLNSELLRERSTAVERLLLSEGVVDFGLEEEGLLVCDESLTGWKERGGSGWGVIGIDTSVGFGEDLREEK